MTKIEKKMLEAVEKAHYDYGNAVGGNEDSFIAEAVAKIALELAEEAYRVGRAEAGTMRTFNQEDYD